MPDAESENVWRSGRPLTVLFWSGVGLAPLAGLLLLLGGGGSSLRVAAVLAVLAVVLIGLSIALRPDVATVRLQLEEALLDEIDTLREEVREDLATAARATHQSFGERVGALQQQVEALRTERGTPPAAAPPAPVRAAAAPAAPPPAARGQFTPPAPPPPVARPQSVAPPYSIAPPQAPPVSATPVGRRRQTPPVSAPAPNGRASVGHSGGGRRSAARHQADGGRRPPAGRANVPGGVYRRTETVQVTRSYVDEHAPGGDRDRGYDDGGGYNSRHDDRGRDWSPPPPRRAAEPPEESWTDQKLREKYGRRPRPYDSDGEESWGRNGDRWQPISAEPISPRPMSAQPVSPPVSAEPRRRRSHRWEDEDSTGVRIGERWAAVRDDGRGQELTLGERRAARHSDDNGSELRIEDRWASVRRDDRGRDDRGRHTNGRGDLGWETNGRGDPDRHTNGRGDPGRHTNGYSGYDRPDYDRPALPAASSEPSWNDSWEEPVRDTRGRRHRSDDDDSGRGYGARSSRRRRLDFELSDDRWR